MVAMEAALSGRLAAAENESHRLRPELAQARQKTATVMATAQLAGQMAKSAQGKTPNRKYRKNGFTDFEKLNPKKFVKANG